MPLLLHTSAQALPVTLDRVRSHLRLLPGDTSEDDLLTGYLGAAVQECEHKLCRAIMPQQWAWVGPALAMRTELRMPPVTAIDSVAITGADGTTQTLDASAWRLLRVSDYISCCQLLAEPPATSGEPDAARILFTAGYASAAAVPSAIVSWLLLRVGSLYENREDTAIAPGQAISLPFDGLLDRYRLWGF